MTVLLENASELANLLREVRPGVLESVLRYPSATGGWQLGTVDLEAYLAEFQGHTLVLIVAPISEVEPATVTCGMCGFALHQAGECASPGVTDRCKLEIAARAREIVDTGEARTVTK